MLVKEPKERALRVETPGFRRRDQRCLFLALEVVKSRGEAHNIEHQEDRTGPDKLFSTVELHEDIEEGVAKQVCQKDIQQDGWHPITRINNRKVNTKAKIHQKKKGDEDFPNKIKIRCIIPPSPSTTDTYLGNCE